MNVKEFYAETNGDYEEVIGRLGKEERILKYLKRFAEEKVLDTLETSLASKDYPEAFRAVHSIKGMCMNLGLRRLQQSSSILCEEIRNGEPQNDITEMVDKVKGDYDYTIEMISKVE